MVWGGILKNEKSDLILFDGSVNAVTYIDNAINDGMLPFFNQHSNAILMHDNAPPHTAFATRTHLRNLGIPVLPWPSKSPDINPIEHIWDELERRLQARQNVPNNVGELRQALIEEWQAIPRDRVRRVICSMRRRVLAVIAANGGHTRY